MTAAPELLLRGDANGSCTLTLNRPDKLNAVTHALFTKLRAHLDTIAADGDALGVIVLRGACRSFCSSHKLAKFGAMDLA